MKSTEKCSNQKVIADARLPTNIIRMMMFSSFELLTYLFIKILLPFISNAIYNCIFDNSDKE